MNLSKGKRRRTFYWAAFMLAATNLTRARPISSKHDGMLNGMQGHVYHNPYEPKVEAR